jgi:hypothetical protein
MPELPLAPGPKDCHQTPISERMHFILSAGLVNNRDSSVGRQLVLLKILVYIGLQLGPEEASIKWENTKLGLHWNEHSRI